MSQEMYGLCCQYHGKIVKISDRSGRIHIGRITRVSTNRVYIEPIGSAGGLGGFGYGYYGGYGYRRYGVGYAIALGAIAGIALAGLFFW